MKIDVITSLDFAVFTTRDYARVTDTSMDAASHQLGRLRKTNDTIVQLTRGIWANTAHRNFSPEAAVPHLIGNEQGYVSFLTALHLHDAISQIPATIQIATTGHTRKLKTPVATYEFLQMKPELLKVGAEWTETIKPWLLATVEKALFDTVYLSTRKGRRFASLPELDLREARFDLRKYRKLEKTLPVPPRIAQAMYTRLETLLTHAKIRP